VWCGLEVTKSGGKRVGQNRTLYKGKGNLRRGEEAREIHRREMGPSWKGNRLV